MYCTVLLYSFPVRVSIPDIALNRTAPPCAQSGASLSRPAPLLCSLPIGVSQSRHGV
jgi:hypothetical protein